MKKKPLIFGVVIVVAIAVLVGRAQMKRNRAAKATVFQQNFLAALYKSKDWQAHAAQFNKGKANAATVFSSPTKIEAFRLFAEGEEKPIGEAAGPGYYSKNFGYFSKVMVRDKKFAARLAAIVLNPKTYPWPGKSLKQCYIEPAVTFRIWKNRQFVDTILCFHCSQLVVMENDPKIPMQDFGGALYGRYRVAGDFDVVRPTLLALTKEAFPDDTNI